jgi:hypothetical protein
MAALADYRSDLGNLLATAVDASTWPNALLDEALRRGLDELNLLLVYETDFTVSAGGYEQDLSSIADIFTVLAVAYPWQEGWDFGRYLATWRLVAPNKICFSMIEPAAGEIIRVRYSKLHKIDDLDSATTTTVADAYRGLVGLWAAAFACEMRRRQLSESPALPNGAGRMLDEVAACFRQRAQRIVSHIPPLGRLRWAHVGLD